MSETNTTESTEATEATETKPKRQRKAKAAPAEAKNKTSLARSIFKSLNRGKNGPDRQKILARFMSDEVGLSKAGASTYYQKLKKELVGAKKKSA